MKLWGGLLLLAALSCNGQPKSILAPPPPVIIKPPPPPPPPPLPIPQPVVFESLAVNSINHVANVCRVWLLPDSLRWNDMSWDDCPPPARSIGGVFYVSVTGRLCSTLDPWPPDAKVVYCEWSK